MKSHVIFIGFILFSLVLNSCQDSKEAKELELVADLNKIHNYVNLNFSGYKDLHDCIKKTGHRMTGPGHGKKAEEFVFNKLKGYGIDVRYDSFEVNVCKRKKSLLLLYVYHNVDTIPCQSLAYTPTHADSRSLLVDLGEGLSENFDTLKDQISGKIVLVNLYNNPTSDSTKKNLHRAEKTALSIQYGAVGIIFVNNIGSNIMLTGTASLNADSILIPAICVSIEKGRYIRAYISGKFIAEARIILENTYFKHYARNVIGQIKGITLPDEKISIGAHLDSWDLSEGAIDNGIGAFALLDLAKTLSDTELVLNRTLEFNFWMSEELGLLGSKDYVKKCLAKGLLDSIRVYINLDMAGNPKGIDIQGIGSFSALINKYNKRILQIDTLYKGELKNNPSLHSDNQSFLLEGVPTLQMISELNPDVYQFYHSDKDNFKLVDKTHMLNTTRIVSMLVYQLANDDSLNVSRLSSEQTKELLLKHNLKEQLEIGKVWKW